MTKTTNRVSVYFKEKRAMSKKFYLKHRETGERFVPNRNNYPVLYDSGRAAFVTFDGFYTYISPVDTRLWELVIKENMKCNE